MWIPNLVMRRYQPLPFDWPAYLSLRAAPAFTPTETALITDVLSAPLSILYAMERLVFVEDGFQKTVNELNIISIHILCGKAHRVGREGPRSEGVWMECGRRAAGLPSRKEAGVWSHGRSSTLLPLVLGPGHRSFLL